MNSKLAALSCKLPPTSYSPSYKEAIELGQVFEAHIPSLDGAAFYECAIWRDLFALTGSLRTFYGARILTIWKDLVQQVRCHDFVFHPSSVRVVRVGTGSAWVDLSYSFQTASQPRSECTLILSVANIEGTWCIWVMRTMLQQLSEHPNVDVYAPSLCTNANGNPPAQQLDQSQFWECVVVGAGQAGLSMAGRLKALNIKCIVLEKNERVGDNWRHRYQSTKLHTTRDSSHLPFDRTFPSSHYGEFLTKDELAKGYEDWVDKFHIDVWLSSRLETAVWLPAHHAWELCISRDGEHSVIRATHVVLAIGAGCQIPIMPSLPDISEFKGTVLHSAQYESPESWKGRSGVVVGTANTAHDVADDMYEAGLSSITMIQRSPTYVLPVEYYKTLSDILYNKDTDTHLADTLIYSNPITVGRLVNMYNLNRMAETEPERFDALERAGFKVIRYGDIAYQLFERFGGHYMDVGTSGKISNGMIKMKSDALPIRYSSKGLVFNDGSELEADVIVFATGFVRNMKTTIEEIFGKEVSAKVDDFWGIDSEGEIEGAFRPSGHPHLWLHGGTCGQARYFSRYLALQIRAALDGTPLKIYKPARQPPDSQ